MQTDNRIKTIQIIGNARLGGVASCLLNYMRHADLERFRFDFVTYGPSPFDEAAHAADPRARIFTIPPFEKNPLGAMRALKKIFGEEDYFAAHSHMTTLSAFALPPAAAAGIPLRICHAHSAFDKHSDHYAVKKLLRPFAAAKANRLMACSRHAAENLFKKRANEAYILKNAVDVSRFSCTQAERAEIKRALGIQEPLALFTGRFVYQKNLPFLLKAFASAAARRPMTLALLGDGKEKEALEAEAAKLGVGGRVRLLPPADPAPWYKAADVFCLPSRYEGLGMSAIEAQAAGTPCILSDAVPQEADVTGGCTFLPAKTDADAHRWGEAMANAAGRIENGADKVRAAGYDLEQAGRLLTDYYAAQAQTLLPQK